MALRAIGLRTLPYTQTCMLAPTRSDLVFTSCNESRRAAAWLSALSANLAAPPMKAFTYSKKQVFYPIVSRFSSELWDV